MCGIAGVLGHVAEPDAARRMVRTLAHRGPDDEGVWSDPSGVALAHRRLAVIDPTPDGAQPMLSRGGRWAIVYNGEVYNHRELGRELGVARGGSDTAVLLAAVERWGVRGAIERCNGMFAFALWDLERRELWLGRDRVGEKPLYYGRFGGRWLFGSELKALCAHRSFSAEVDRGALSLYVRHRYVPAPYSIYAGVRKVMPGTLVRLDADGTESTETYWSALAVAERGLRDPFPGDAPQATDVLDAALHDAVGVRMVADVPLGAFLSGGIDSSLVVALMQARSAAPVRTFSIGFTEPDYNEAPYAKAVAHHLGCDHTELYVTPRQALDVVPDLPSMYDEPFADASQIPTALVSRLARRDVTVALSGDGGDELFGGYGRYATTLDAWRRISRVPSVLRRPRLLRALAAVAGSGHRREIVRRLGSVSSPEGLYLDALSLWKDPSRLVLGGSEPPTPHTSPGGWPEAGFAERMMFLDLVGYLPDDILAKVDRASMAESLEARVPMLDHRIVELAWRLPPALRTEKRVLKAVLGRYVPRELFERPKMGFGVPVADWLRGPLRGWAERLLGAVDGDGYLAGELVRRRWAAHQAGEDWSAHLWTVLQFQAWLESVR